MSEIILYSNDCPKCKVLETKLNSKNIKFTKISDLEILRSKNIMSVPVLEVDNNFMSFVDANTWVNNQILNIEESESENILVDNNLVDLTESNDLNSVLNSEIESHKICAVVVFPEPEGPAIPTILILSSSDILFAISVISFLYLSSDRRTISFGAFFAKSLITERIFFGGY